MVILSMMHMIIMMVTMVVIYSGWVYYVNPGGPLPPHPSQSRQQQTPPTPKFFAHNYPAQCTCWWSLQTKFSINIRYNIHVDTKCIRSIKSIGKYEKYEYEQWKVLV